MENYNLSTTSSIDSSYSYTFPLNTSSVYNKHYNKYYYKTDYNYYDYDSGYETLAIKQINDREYAKAYNAGIEEGKDQNIEKYFEIFKKLILPYPQGYEEEMIEEVFGTSNIFEIVNNYKGKEIINMIKDYYNKV